MRLRPGSLPIFWQTLLLLLASLVATQIVSMALVLSLPAPRPEFNRLSEVADTLAGTRSGRRERERTLTVRVEPRAPEPAEGMTSDPDFTARIAERLELPEAKVRLYFMPDRGGAFRMVGRRRDRDEVVPIRRGEPLFFNAVVAAAEIDGAWRVLRTPPAPRFSAWQQRLLLWFALSAVLMLPFAWFFARRLARPIGNFARAADRLGNDPNAPPVPEEGPAELRVTAHALNRMQQRLSDYVSERTGMIGAIAHDLRTPLARIAFRIEGAPDDVRDKVLADIEQMRAMIAATIGFVKGTGGTGERQRLDLAALLRRIVASEEEVGRAVTIASAEPAPISGDPLALARLFQNLIDNAIAYGGAAELIVAQDNGRAIVRVRDRGPGLAPEAIERMFEPFQRGDPSRNRATGGIGLGLTIARSIARDHGGTLVLSNRPEGGLEALSSFPLAESS